MKIRFMDGLAEGEIREIPNGQRWIQVAEPPKATPTLFSAENAAMPVEGLCIKHYTYKITPPTVPGGTGEAWLA